MYSTSVTPKSAANKTPKTVTAEIPEFNDDSSSIHFNESLSKDTETDT